MPITAAPFIGLPRVTLERRPAPVITSTSSEEFQLSEGSLAPRRRQLSETSLIPDKPEFTSVHDPENPELIHDPEEYKLKLSDPDFIQTITKAHVFHATNLNEDDNLRLDDPIVNAAPVHFSPSVFHIQDSNPFGEKPDPFRSELPEPVSLPYPVQPEPVLPPEQPSLEEIAPAAKLAHTSKDNGHFERPEVVYDPVDVYGKKIESRRVDDFHRINTFYDGGNVNVDVNVETEDNQVAETEPPALEELSEDTEGTTESSTFAEPETTTQYIDPIAEHVNKLLRHYLTTQEPLKEIPSLLFDDETGSVVLEYLSPDGQHGRVEEVTQEVQDTEGSTLQTFQAVPDDYQRTGRRLMLKWAHGLSLWLRYSAMVDMKLRRFK